MLLRHKRDIYGSLLGDVWYATFRENQARVTADLQNLLNVADDLLAPRKDVASVVTLGERIKMERLKLGTLIVVCQSPDTYASLRATIDNTSSVLRKRKKAQFGGPFVPLDIGGQDAATDLVCLGIFPCLAHASLLAA